MPHGVTYAYGPCLDCGHTWTCSWSDTVAVPQRGDCCPKCSHTIYEPLDLKTRKPIWTRADQELQNPQYAQHVRVILKRLKNPPKEGFDLIEK